MLGALVDEDFGFCLVETLSPHQRGPVINDIPNRAEGSLVDNIRLIDSVPASRVPPTSSRCASTPPRRCMNVSQVRLYKQNVSEFGLLFPDLALFNRSNNRAS